MNGEIMNKKKKKQTTSPIDETSRIRFPRAPELFGVVMGIMGGGRMLVLCKDGKERMCRVPGRLKNKLWIKDGDIVIVVPWEIQGDKKGDVIWRYTPTQAKWLKKKGFIEG